MTAEQQARDLLERLDVEDAQSYSSGELVELANLIADADRYRRALQRIRELATKYTPSPDVVEEIAVIAKDAL